MFHSLSLSSVLISKNLSFIICEGFKEKKCDLWKSKKIPLEYDTANKNGLAQQLS